MPRKKPQLYTKRLTTEKICILFVFELTVCYCRFFFQVVKCSIEEYDETSNAHDTLNGETAPVRPKGCTPVPLSMSIHFQNRTKAYEQTQYNDNFGHQLHRSIARCFFVFHAKTTNTACYSCRSSNA